MILLSQSSSVEKHITTICQSLDLSFHFKKIAIIIAKDKKGLFAHINSRVLSGVSVFLATHLVGGGPQKAKMNALPSVSQCDFRDLCQAYLQVRGMLDQVLESKVLSQADLPEQLSL